MNETENQLDREDLTAEQIDSRIDERLNNWGIVYIAAQKPGKLGERNNWQIAWTVGFTSRKTGKNMATDFYQGMAHHPKYKHTWAKPKTTDYQYREQRIIDDIKAGRGGRKPTAALVLHCLMMDATAGEITFSQWCDETGYDHDSRKAEQIYKQCQEMADSLARVFTRQQLEEIRQLTANY